MLSTVKTPEIAERAPGSVVTLAGLIVGLQELVVKSGNYAGKKMARMRLEDLEGGVPVVVFPRTFEEVRELLVDDTVVVIQGKVEDREEPGLILEQIMTIEDALRRFEGGLVVHIEPEDQGLLVQLKATLEQHKGKRPLYLTVKGTDGHVRRVRAGGDLRVDINAELTEEVDRLLGRGRVKLARM
jgi:DNA polymerase-3 subunit alpha